MAVIKKDYLTFAELRDHWGISDDEMHYMIGNGELVPSVVWMGAVDIVRKLQTGGERVYSGNGNHRIGGWVFLVRPDDTRRIRSGRHAHAGPYLPNRYGFIFCQWKHPHDDPAPAESYVLTGIDEITNEEIRVSGAFLNRSIELCELIHPELLSNLGATAYKADTRGVIPTEKTNAGVTVAELKIHTWPLLRGSAQTISNALNRSADWVKPVIISQKPKMVNPAHLALLLTKVNSSRSGAYANAEKLRTYIAENFSEYLAEYEAAIDCGTT